MGERERKILYHSKQADNNLVMWILYLKGSLARNTIQLCHILFQGQMRELGSHTIRTAEQSCNTGEKHLT